MIIFVIKLWFLLPLVLNGLVKTKSWSMWLPQNNIFICQCNLFAYCKYMSTPSPVCCQSPGMILMRNINGRCPENMLVHPGPWLPSILLTFVEDDSITHSAYVDLMSLIQPTNLIKRCFSRFFAFFQIPGLFPTGRHFFSNSRFSWYCENPDLIVEFHFC